jgi:hypothetical protein
VIDVIAARIDQQGAGAVAARGERRGGDGAQQSAASRSGAAVQARCKKRFRGDPLLWLTRLNGAPPLVPGEL